MKNGNRLVVSLGSLTIAFLLIALTAAAGLVYLHSYTANEFKQATEAAALADEAIILNATSWSVLSPAISGIPDNGTLNAYGDFDQQRAHVQKLAAEGPSEMRQEIDAFIQMSDEAVNLARANNIEEATLALNEVTPVIMEIGVKLLDISNEQTRSAEQTRVYASGAAVGLVIAALAAVTGILWRYSSAQRRAREAEAEREILQRSEARFRPLVEHSADTLGVCDTEMTVTFVSASVERYGVSAEKVVGVNAMDTIHPEDASRFTAFFEDIKQRPGYSETGEFRWRLATGECVAEVTCTNQLENPDVKGIVFNMHDVTDRKMLEEQLRHQAFHDSLTGLANRLTFVQRLEHALLRNGLDSRRRALSVIYLDLDHFKNVNDELGHSVGDELLKELSQRILTCLRPADTAARLGGDEFAILLEDASTQEEAQAVADRLLAELSKPVLIAGSHLRLSASIGVVVADPFMMTVEEVVRNADIAMYDAKAAGRGCVRMFQPNSRSAIMERLHMTNELNTAVEENQLQVLYQPTVDLQTAQITGFEALVRWQHPTLGLLEPDQFIPLAEDTGIISAIGEIVLRKACMQARTWHDMYPKSPPRTISVNVSARQLERGGLVSSVRRIIDETGVDPEQIILELTESVLIDNPRNAVAVMSELKDLGVKLALDDFGTGYSSLSYLKGFPIDILKIDRAFTEGIDRSDRERLIFQNVVDLGNMMELKIVAEGIERQGQLEQLKALEGVLGQGYLFARPLEPQAVEMLLDSGDRNSRSSDDAARTQDGAVIAA